MSARPVGDRFGDVLQAAAYARVIVERGRARFDEDVTLRPAGERVIELLAEAVNAAVDQLERAYPDYPWHEPIGMRNLLAHEYWRSDPDLVWTTLSEDIPRSRSWSAISAGRRPTTADPEIHAGFTQSPVE